MKKLSRPLYVKLTDFPDDRGWFAEIFNRSLFREHFGDDFELVQANVSVSHQNVLRGLHYQTGKNAQAKIISVLNGKILDVIVDLRQSSETYGKSQQRVMSANDRGMLFVPSGYAHGFLALEENTTIIYFVDADYDPAHEQSLHWNDGDLDINWNIANPICSSKDQNAKSFRNCVKFP